MKMSLFQLQPFSAIGAPAHSRDVAKNWTFGYRGSIRVQKLENMEERTSVWKLLRR